MIPELVSIGSVWKTLPPGIHDASMNEIEARYATNDVRKRLLLGLKQGIHALQLAGCKTVYIDGSFVTEKEIPGDFDACWDPSGVDASKLDPVLLDFTNMRQKQKSTFGGEFFPSSARADGMRTFVDFFQVDRYTGRAKGLIRVHLS